MIYVIHRCISSRADHHGEQRTSKGNTPSHRPCIDIDGADLVAGEEAILHSDEHAYLDEDGAQLQQQQPEKVSGTSASSTLYQENDKIHRNGDRFEENGPSSSVQIVAINEEALLKAKRNLRHIVPTRRPTYKKEIFGAIDTLSSTDKSGRLLFCQ